MPTARFVLRRGYLPLRRRRWYWQLVASNSEPLATSEPYTTLAAALAGIEALRRAAADALIEDDTE
jgi:uncharacterized protein YegP (UPF0339 family)